eukprot:TRINITY_DN2019_c1_g2_i24.p1 TRINITY_DN2019_c1_g2~~TRINITY_DN2019_c1_g2_i24.p1  ORF type:complete len:573 (+),score=138.49 TRINITY_DN2019_c1_g2_i24:183-1721(+)
MNKLKKKYCTITLMDDKKIRADYVVGSVEINLHVLATGPTKHELLIHDAGTPTGLIKFELSMEHYCEVAVSLKDLLLDLTPLAQSAAGYNLFLNVFPSVDAEGDQDSVKTDPVKDTLTPAWRYAKQLHFFATLKDLHENNLVFEIKNQKPGFFNSEEHVGDCWLQTKTIYSLTENELSTFRENVLDESNNIIGTLSGSIYFSNGPKLANMRAGIHNDNGIFDARLLRPELEVPDLLISLIETRKNTEPSSSSDAGSSSSSSSSSSRVSELSDGGGLESGGDSVVLSGDNADDLQRVVVPVEDVPLPNDWLMAEDAMGNTVFVDVKSQNDMTSNLGVCYVDPRLLPVSWEQRVNIDGRVYFKYHNTRTTTWTDPRYMPEDWSMRMTKTGKVYFADDKTKKTSWTDPRGLPPGVEQSMFLTQTHHEFTKSKSLTSSPTLLNRCWYRVTKLSSYFTHTHTCLTIPFFVNLVSESTKMDACSLWITTERPRHGMTHVWVWTWEPLPLGWKGKRTNG